MEWMDECLTTTLDMQDKSVCQHPHYPVPEQGRHLPREDFEGAADRMLPSLRGREYLRRCQVMYLSEFIPPEEIERGERKEENSSDEHDDTRRRRFDRHRHYTKV